MQRLGLIVSLEPREGYTNVTQVEIWEAYIESIESG
jgi:hypothetical protein